MPFQAPKQDEHDDESDSGGALFAEINITPLTDVILVLLIIFMVSSSAMVDAMREGMIDVTLPSASSGASASAAPEALIIGVTADGRIFIGGEAVSQQRMAEMLDEMKKVTPARPIVVQADGELQHKHVVEVIDALRQAGFSNVGIATESDEGGGGKK